jgi:hypothetical protein
VPCAADCSSLTAAVSRCVSRSRDLEALLHRRVRCPHRRCQR